MLALWCAPHSWQSAFICPSSQHVVPEKAAAKHTQWWPLFVPRPLLTENLTVAGCCSSFVQTVLPGRADAASRDRMRGCVVLPMRDIAVGRWCTDAKVISMKFAALPLPSCVRDRRASWDFFDRSIVIRGLEQARRWLSNHKFCDLLRTGAPEHELCLLSCALIVPALIGIGSIVQNGMDDYHAIVWYPTFKLPCFAAR